MQLFLHPVRRRVQWSLQNEVQKARPPLPSSAGHINPAGLCLYGSPAHTSVMRVNKQRAKGHLSPQNKGGHRGKGGGRKRSAARGNAQITVRASSREWCTRKQPPTGNYYKQRTGRVYERTDGIVFICQICYFLVSDSDCETCKKMKGRTSPAWKGWIPLIQGGGWWTIMRLHLYCSNDKWGRLRTCYIIIRFSDFFFFSSPTSLNEFW